MKRQTLQERAIIERDLHGGVRAAARYWGITHGPISKAIKGENSPALRKLWGIPKQPYRIKICIDCDGEELRQDFNSMVTEYEFPNRAEFLRDMMDVYNDTMENMPY